MPISSDEFISLVRQVGHGRRDVSEAALAALSVLDRQAYLEAIRNLLSERGDDLQLWRMASYSVAKIHREAAPELLIPFLGDENPHKRWHIVGLLGDSGSRQAVEPLMQVVENDPDPDIRHLAAFSLGKLGDKRALDVLQWVMENDLGEDYESRPVAGAAREAIERISNRP